MSVTRVLAVASEIYPVIKTGGLADVVGALPAALKAEGVQTRTLVPGYPAVLNALQSVQVALDLPHFHGGAVRVLSGSCAGIDLFVLDAAYLFGRPGNPYTAPDGADWPDNALRYAALGRVAAAIGQGAIAAFVPDIVHAHDWQAGLTHAYLAYSGRSRPGTVMTVHNLAYQGQFPQALLGEIGLPPESFTVEGIEYYGAIGYLKAGLRFADRITTVSPTYAREIQQPAEGMGLDGLLRGRSDVLSGILNGIDISVWDPATDPSIASDFDADRIERRAPNKAALQRQFGLRESPEPLLLGVISRLSWQKGLDLLLQALPEVLSGDVQIAVLGSGDADLQDGYRAIAAANPDRDRRAHRVRREPGAPDPGRRGCPGGAVAVRAVRAHPALRPAIRRGPDRLRCRRTGGHRAQRRRAGRSCCDRNQIRAGDARKFEQRASAGQRAVSKQIQLAKIAAQRHGGGCVVA